ncbi:hypothetical protein ACIGH6_11815 [Brachybacterium paraconglomeratum]|uniref:hypothetical protein n=1 Tax=Brachybacterium paraconglomeratum TaxID=173362 RepID=UPI0037C8556F
MSRDTGARGVRRGTRLRGGASLAALLATGALLAGCGTAVPEAADTEAPEPAAVAIPAPAEPEQDGAAADDAAGNASGIVTTEGDQGEGDQEADDDQGEEVPGPAAANLPASWADTYSAESLPLGSGYLVVQNLYGEHRGATSMEASDIAGQEFFASSGATCEGAATLAGDTADCVLPDDGRGMGEQAAVVHLVPAASGATSLLVEVDVSGGLAVAEAPQGIGGLSAAVPSEVTLEEVEGAMVTAVMMADSPEGPLPEELGARCELRDGGRHALCEIVGTPDGGGDGSWYGTLQPGYGNYVVLATKLPA